MKVLEFDKIHRAYKKGEDVLKDVSFSLRKGEVVGLLGKNGAGKTTLIHIAMGMIEAQQGAVRVFGRSPREEPVEMKKRVGYVSEDQILPGFMRVDQAISLHRELFPTWDEDLAQSLCERFEIPLGRKVKTLSKGQARRVALLCAVAHRPELLLLDEPAGGLDPAARREFLETSIQLLNESGSTILFSSHYMTDVERLANRVVMIQDGGVLMDSALDELQENYALVLVPHGPKASRENLQRLEGCMGVRKRYDAMHAVFELDPQQCRDQLESKLGITDSRCRSVPLEEMFIELMGGGVMILTQVRREFAVRSMAWWIPISICLGLWIWGVSYRMQTTIGSIPLEDSPAGTFLVISMLWLVLSIYLLSAGATRRCPCRIDPTLPLDSRRMWLNHMVILMAGAWIILGIPVGIMATGNYLCDRQPFLEPGIFSMFLHLSAVLLLALGVFQARKSTLWELPQSVTHFFFVIITLIIGFVIIKVLCALPRGFALIPLGLSLLLLARTYMRIPPTFTLAPRAAEKKSPLKAKTYSRERPDRAGYFWLLHSTIWRSSFGNLTWGYLFIFVFHGFVLGMRDPGEESQGTRTVYLFFTWMILTSWHLVTKGYCHILESLPISRKRIFAVYIIPSLATVMLGYGMGFTLSTAFAPQHVNVRPLASSPCIDLPREFWEIGQEGELPRFESPWGESAMPQGKALYKGSAIQVYNPYCLAEGSSAGFTAFAISHAVERVYGKKIPYEEIRNRYLEMGKDGKIILKADRFTLLEDHPDLKKKSEGPVFPVIMLMVGLSWFLFMALSYRLHRSDISNWTENFIIISLFFIFLAPGMGGLLLDGMDVVDLSSISIAFGILIRQMNEAMPCGTLLAWLVSALLLCSGYLLALFQFQRMEARTRPQSVKRT